MLWNIVDVSFFIFIYKCYSSLEHFGRKSGLYPGILYTLYGRDCKFLHYGL